jgi:pilus assembly protein TadC
VEKIILAILPALLIIILYAIILSRKGEVHQAKTSFKNYDWITNLTLIFGVIAFLNGMNAMGIEFSKTWSVVF